MFDVLKTLSGLVKTRDGKERKVAVSHSESKQVGAESPKEKVAPATKPVVSTQPVPTQQSSSTVSIDATLAIAQAKAKEMIVEAKDEAFRIKRDADDQARKKLEAIERRDGALEEREKRLTQYEQDSERRMNKLREDVEKRLEEAEKRVLEANKYRDEQISRLEKTAHLTREEAKTQILSELKDRLKEEMAREVREALTSVQQEADEKAKQILVDAMKHGATSYVAEYTVSVVKIADEEAKGRIIGKEGRNIRAFENVTGVDVDLDEEGVIRLSCFDPVRREIARVSLERLLKDGRVQPGRIEEVVEIVKKEIERIMFEEGQKLCHAVGVYNLPAPLMAMLGRFKYRFSYGQNMITHTLEETKIGIALAHEVGADANVVRLGCLLHDIGKIVTDKEGNHIDLGVELLKKYNVPQKVIDCVAQHHEDTPFSSIESMLVYISDAISGARPGARYENYEEYIKRLRDMEDIAKTNSGVVEAFAFSAGRELRVVVDPGKVDDATATLLAREIKDTIEEKVTYPGTVKISVIRELRATEVAK